MRLIAASFVAISLVAGCAKQPEAIAAVSPGANAFAGYSCSQLATEEVQLTQNLENYSAEQRNAASGDAFGVFLIGLPLSSMSGGDREAQIAITRGQLQAIDQRQAQRGC